MIPLSMPNLNGNEWTYLKDCLDSTYVSSVGAYVNKFEEQMAAYTGAKYAVACVNGTSALHIGMLVTDVQPDTYVIIPNITFIASANAIKYCNAHPIFMDVEEDTWQMDLTLLEEFFEKNTTLSNGKAVLKKDGKRISAIMPVHVLGNMVNMDKLVEISQKYGVPIVEDASESLGSYFNGKNAGTFGEIGCFSFNGNKIMTTGGGGMIVTDDEQLAKRAKHLTTQAKQDPLEYIHDEIGYNYRMVNVLAALGVAQLEQMPQFLQRKKEIVAAYENAFQAMDFIKPQTITEGVTSNHWLYTVQLPESRAVQKFLTAHKIQSRPLWCPMNRLIMFEDNLYYTKQDVSGLVYEECLSLPCSTNIKDSELKQVTGAVAAFYAEKGVLGVIN